MMGFLPNLYCIKYKKGSLNSTNNPQKLEFQDKGREETDKVKENIPETLADNRTVVVIKARTKAIKGEREAKGKGSRRRRKRIHSRKNYLRKGDRDREREYE